MKAWNRVSPCNRHYMDEYPLPTLESSGASITAKLERNQTYGFAITLIKFVEHIGVF